MSEVRTLQNELVELNDSLNRAVTRNHQLEREVASCRTSLDVTLRELSACKDTVTALKEENARLRRDLVVLNSTKKDIARMDSSRTTSPNAARGPSSQVDPADVSVHVSAAHNADGSSPPPAAPLTEDALRSTAADDEEVSSFPTTDVAASFMGRCFAYGEDPPIPVLRALAANQPIVCPESMSFKQLTALVEVLGEFREDGTLDGVGSITVPIDNEKHTLLSGLVDSCPTLTDLRLLHIDDRCSSALAALLLANDQITRVALDKLAMRDEALQEVFRAIIKRQVLAEQNSSQPLLVSQWDLSGCTISDPMTTISLIQGNSIEHLDLSGCALTSELLREVLLRCHALRSLVCTRSKLDNKACRLLNDCPNVVELDIRESPGLTEIDLEHVQVLRSDLCGVFRINCPSMEDFPVACSTFQVTDWIAPNVRSIAFRNVTLAQREMTAFAQSSALESIDFVDCRLQGLEILLRRARRLTHLSLHGSKGVTDTDLQAISNSIETVDLSDNFCLTDKALLKLSSGCLKLRRLTLKRCSNLTSDGVLLFAGHEKLQYLNVLGVKKVTTAALLKLSKASLVLEHIVHDTLISPTVRVERGDEEENERRRLQVEERELSGRRHLLPLTHSAVAVSPRRPETSPQSSHRPHRHGQSTESLVSPL